jgi:hypothetical protein
MTTLTTTNSLAGELRASGFSGELIDRALAARRGDGAPREPGRCRPAS